MRDITRLACLALFLGFGCDDAPTAGDGNNQPDMMTDQDMDPSPDMLGDLAKGNDGPNQNCFLNGGSSGPMGHWCGAKCVDTENDSTNCGGCDVTCSSGQICRQHTCQVPQGCQPTDPKLADDLPPGLVQEPFVCMAQATAAKWYFAKSVSTAYDVSADGCNVISIDIGEGSFKWNCGKSHNCYLNCNVPDHPELCEILVFGPNCTTISVENCPQNPVTNPESCKQVSQGTQ
ncbi:MAG TPA: hypothetical protein VFQ60_05270 [Patescibacteria group bacterium]|nr:hypothetical protein [Patescibacteria group bacterium]